jgi:TolB-like protein/Tfp pilus assembly protein PilF
MAISTGTRLGPYEILAPLGKGGMGEVYRARDTRLGREVAVKVLPASLSTDPDRLHRFEGEARAASALNHSNILTVHDFGSERGAPYVVTELLDGETLRDRLSGGRLPARKALDYAAQVARGLAAAHEKGIVHRDLKPENLFVTKDGRVKILDFGLAKLTHPEASGAPLTQAPTETRGTEPGVVMGTVGYMSPEQVRGQLADHRSDIFSFGAVLYETLTGERAFRGDTAVETMNAILKEDPPELARTVDEIPPSLERIVRRCLEKIPDERFQSARDLAFALAETQIAPTAVGHISGPSPRRGRLLVRSALGFAALLIALLAINAPKLRRQWMRTAEASRVRSLAVLPLENLSGDPEQEFFADGMTEALIADLGKIRALRVISRTSAMRYKGSKKSLPEIARDLDVDAIVEGSVLQSGGRVRITAQLIQAATDRHLWSESYERDLRDILTLQSDVAQAIAKEIRIAVSPQEQARLAKNRRVDPEAHRSYLLGRYWWNKRSAEGFQKALQYFEQAIAKDPTFAAAYAGLSDTYSSLGYYVLRPREAFPKARAAAAKALELDDTLAEVHASFGNIAFVYDWNWVAAEKSLKRSIELSPGYAPAHHWYSLLLSALGRLDEASAEIRRALELDPLSLIMNHNVGLQLYYARRYDEAIEQYRKTLEMDPHFSITRLMLMYAYAEKGMFREAIAQAEGISHSNAVRRAALAYAYARAGDRPQALGLVADDTAGSERDHAAPEVIAIAYVGLGEKDEAFAWLEKSYEEHTSFATFLKPSPFFDPLRSDPRFAELLRRLGLPP